jgi:hypothetical protein
MEVCAIILKSKQENELRTNTKQNCQRSSPMKIIFVILIILYWKPALETIGEYFGRK